MTRPKHPSMPSSNRHSLVTTPEATRVIHAGQQFGGKHSEEKLVIVKEYLDLYTTVLSQTEFGLGYIDPFAGNGYSQSRGKTLDGSPMLALSTENRCFDYILLNDSKQERVKELRDNINARFPKRDTEVRYSTKDANVFIEGLGDELKQKHRKWPWGTRAVMFIDPFGLQLHWESLRAIAQTRVIDTLILFPQLPVARVLTVEKPDEDSWNSEKLDGVFPKGAWRKAYNYDEMHRIRITEGYDTQGRLTGLEGVDEHQHQRGDAGDLALLYRHLLKEEFGSVYNQDVELVSDGIRKYNLMFAVANRDHKATSLATKLFAAVHRNIRTIPDEDPIDHECSNSGTSIEFTKIQWHAIRSTSEDGGRWEIAETMPVDGKIDNTRRRFYNLSNRDMELLHAEAYLRSMVFLGEEAMVWGSIAELMVQHGVEPF